MGKENKEQQLDQLLRGVYRMCVTRDECKGCPFYITKCTFGEPKPATWFDEETIEIKAVPDIEKPVEIVAEEPQSEPQQEPLPEAQPEPQPQAASEVVEQIKENDDSDGTWIVSTTMGGVFTKYVFICSKCGYRKESMFSITPLTFCPECAKKKAEQT